MCYKIIDKTYQVEILDGIKYYYRPRYGGEARDNNYANRFVYECTIPGVGGKVKLYTRFRYGDVDAFLNAIAKPKEQPKEEGGQVIPEIPIYELLLPDSATATQNMNTTFAEGVRVSLAPYNTTTQKGATIWYKYYGKDKADNDGVAFINGSITCWTDEYETS